MRIQTKDGRTYQKPISSAQYAWHNGVPPDEKEDVALTIASTMFCNEILVMYLKRDPDFKPEESIRDVRAYRQRNGIFAFSITFNHDYPTLGNPMDQDDSDRYRRLDPDDRPGFLMQLDVNHLTNQSAKNIVDRIDRQAQQKTCVRSEHVARCNEEAIDAEKIKQSGNTEYLTPRQCAVLLGLCVRTIYYHLEANLIPFIHLKGKTLISRANIDKMFENPPEYIKREKKEAEPIEEFYTFCVGAKDRQA